MIYLACPFTHPDPAVREHRYRTSCIAAAKLMRHGNVVFNPLSHSVPINEFLSDVDSHEFWMAMDIPILRRCDELLVLGLEGWQESRGVQTEIFEAMASAKPIIRIEESDIERLPLIPKTAKHFLKSRIFKEADDV